MKAGRTSQSLFAFEFRVDLDTVMANSGKNFQR
jgi:hypothetical protein